MGGGAGDGGGGGRRGTGGLRHPEAETPEGFISQETGRGVPFRSRYVTFDIPLLQ